MYRRRMYVKRKRMEQNVRVCEEYAVVCTSILGECSRIYVYVRRMQWSVRVCEENAVESTCIRNNSVDISVC